jgi:hypothetical protein
VQVRLHDRLSPDTIPMTHAIAGRSQRSTCALASNRMALFRAVLTRSLSQELQ